MYSDNVNFVNSSNAWFKRGGRPNNGANTGSFAFNHNDGGANANNSFRGVFRVLYSISFKHLRMLCEGL